MRYVNTRGSALLVSLIAIAGLLLTSASRTEEAAATAETVDVESIDDADRNVATLSPIPLFKEFDPPVIERGETTTVIFEIDNTFNGVPVVLYSLTDPLPAGMVVAPTPNESTTCSAGAINAQAGATVITYQGGVVPPGAICDVRVDVTTNTVGTIQNIAELRSDAGLSPFAGPGVLTVTMPPIGPPVVGPPPVIFVPMTPVAVVTPTPAATPTPVPTPPTVGPPGVLVPMTPAAAVTPTPTPP